MATNGIPRRYLRAASRSTSDRLVDKSGPEGSNLFDMFMFEGVAPPLGPVPPNRDGTMGLGPAVAIGEARPGSPSGAVAVPSVGSDCTAQGRRVAEEYGSLVGARLPLLRVPDLHRVRLELGSSYPHAAPVLDRILGDLAGRPHVAMRPTLLVGSLRNPVHGDH